MEKSCCREFDYQQEIVNTLEIDYVRGSSLNNAAPVENSAR